MGALLYNALGVTGFALQEGLVSHGIHGRTRKKDEKIF